MACRMVFRCAATQLLEKGGVTEQFALVQTESSAFKGEINNFIRELDLR